MVAANDDVTCQELVEIVSDYLEGALPEADRERFDAHLEVCEGCRRYLDQMRTTIRVVGTLSEDDLDPGARDQLLQLFREWNRTVERPAIGTMGSPVLKPELSSFLVEAGAIVSHTSAVLG